MNSANLPSNLPPDLPIKPPDTLADWLDLLAQRSPPNRIDMGLTRARQVWQVLGSTFSCPVIMVGGTNGKGSTCAMLEAVLLQAGYKTGLFSKPHFLKINENARIVGNMPDDAALAAAFQKVEEARGSVFLTHFEFTTIALLYLLAQAELDVVILEVGMGGRDDVVNLVDADVAIITSIDLDHIEYLGDTREKIAAIKAGIFRPGCAAVCSDPQVPQSLVDHAQAIGVDLWLFGRDFNYSGDKLQWNFAGRTQRRNSLAYPGLRGANQLLNASAALAALEILRQRLPVGAQEIRTGLALVELPGRFQVLPGRPSVILDVAHNPHAAATLAQNLANMGFYRYTYAVFGAMQDKDLKALLHHLRDKVDHWCLAELNSPRSASPQALLQALREAGCLAPEVAPGAVGAEQSVTIFSNVQEAYANACERAGDNDRIVVFGSFLTVAAVMAERRS